MMKVIDMFCGCGGMGGGFEDAGCEIVQAFDIDKFAVQSYNANFATKADLLDIRNISADYLNPADGWTFGFPCQDLSVAGKQAGLYNGERSKLFFEVMRLLDEVPEKPKFILAENVKGLKKYLPVLEQEYAKRGYRMYYTLYNSKYFGVPQNRERYFVLGIRNDISRDFCFEEQQVDFVPALWTVLETEVEDKYYIDDAKAEKIIKQASGKIGKWGSIHACLTPDRVNKRQNGRRAKEDNEEMFTLTSQDIHGIIMLGNINPSGKGMNGNVYYAGLAPTLTTNKGEGIKIFVDEPHLKLVGMLDIKGKESIRRVYDPKGICPCLTTMQGGNREPKILVSGTYGQKEGFVPNEVACTLDVSYYKGYKGLGCNQNRPAVAEIYQIPRGKNEGNLHNIAPTLTSNSWEHNNFLLLKYRVRKLTPRECFRLQGFEDSYNFVCSNSQLYKQAGNAVTRTVSRAVADQILVYFER